MEPVVMGDESRSLSELAAMRREYARSGLHEADLDSDWLTVLARWLGEATDAQLPEPNAMILATADAAGRPSARAVLLKGLDERGLVFFTNLESQKASELATNPYASAVFPWHPIGRQVVVCGRVTPIERAETDRYFATRPRNAQLGAWASPQSRVIADRAALDELLAAADKRFPEGTELTAPPHWGGLRIAPETVEFWQGREGRLHDRLRYRRSPDGWVIERLAP
jgi:pyridoxamine 5'-phosphate oxidase